MGLILAQIDERLVRGIIVTQWASAVKAKRIMVVDDQVTQDGPRKATMRLSKPAGVGMSLIDVETGITNFKAGRYDSHNVLSVVSNIKTSLDSSEQGITIPEANVGIMLDKNDHEELTKDFAVSPKELQQLQQLADKGIPISYQFTPSGKEESLGKFI